MFVLCHNMYQLCKSNNSVSFLGVNRIKTIFLSSWKYERYGIRGLVCVNLLVCVRMWACSASGVSCMDAPEIKGFWGECALNLRGLATEIVLCFSKFRLSLEWWIAVDQSVYHRPFTVAFYAAGVCSTLEGDIYFSEMLNEFGFLLLYSVAHLEMDEHVPCK